jgi:hypothetical protein
MPGRLDLSPPHPILSMQILARLVHADASSRVVEVAALEGDRWLGSSLGEASSAEEAEDRGLTRLLARLKITPDQGPGSFASAAAASRPSSALAASDGAPGAGSSVAGAPASAL